MTTHFKTYDQVGIKEDVSDVISNLAPTETPFQSLLGTEKVNNTIYQWQEDDLAAVSDNAHVEGADAQDENMTPTKMRANHTQIFQKTIRVSGSADAVSTYGRAKETAYQLGKKSAELKRQIEYILIGTSQDATPGASNAPRRFGNVWGADANGDPLIDSSVTVDNSGSPKALDEQMILTASQKLYEAGGSAKYIMIKPADSLLMAGFTASAGRVREIPQDDRKIVNVVDLYVSPFGEQKVILNRFIMADSALLFDPANWKKMELRPFTRTLLAKNGDSDRHFMVGEFGLKHVNYKASAAIKGLTGSQPLLPQ